MMNEHPVRLPEDLRSAVMAVPDGKGGTYPFSPESLSVSADGSRLLLPLVSEHTEAGRGLVEAIWFGRTVTLWANGVRFALRPERCHIVGKVFSSCYLAAKAKDPESEVSAVWELIPVTSEPAAAPAPEPLPLHCCGRQELHLDHPSLHRK